MSCAACRRLVARSRRRRRESKSCPTRQSFPSFHSRRSARDRLDEIVAPTRRPLRPVGDSREGDILLSEIAKFRERLNLSSARLRLEAQDVGTRASTELHRTAARAQRSTRPGTCATCWSRASAGRGSTGRYDPSPAASSVRPDDRSQDLASRFLRATNSAPSPTISTGRPLASTRSSIEEQAWSKLLRRRVEVCHRELHPDDWSKRTESTAAAVCGEAWLEVGIVITPSLLGSGETAESRKVAGASTSDPALSTLLTRPSHREGHELHRSQPSGVANSWS